MRGRIWGAAGAILAGLSTPDVVLASSLSAPDNAYGYTGDQQLLALPLS
jgi:hypothetical protein